MACLPSGVLAEVKDFITDRIVGLDAVIVEIEDSVKEAHRAIQETEKKLWEFRTLSLASEDDSMQSINEQLRVQVHSDREHIFVKLRAFEKQLTDLLHHRGRLSSLLGSAKGYDVEQLTFALQSLQDEFAPPPTKRARSNNG